MTPVVVILSLVIILADGSTRLHNEPRETIDQCYADAQKFVLLDPEKFGAMALGGGCIIHPIPGRPS